jgi:hypothetical protein
VHSGQLPPAIIDLAPYWRPAAYASAVVLADALLFEGADGRVLAAAGHIEDFGQYLVRALIFRIASDRLLFPDKPPDGHRASVVGLAVRLAARDA